MKVLVLGASGMLGHKIIQTCSKQFETYGTFRSKPPQDWIRDVYGGAKLISNVNVENISDVESAILKIEPDVVVNCIGIVKQLPEANNYIRSIMINSLFPHQASEICSINDIKFIHFSTDCVFSGSKGNYYERDFADSDDLYGRTKYLGEINEPGCLTIRTSIVGRELHGYHGLFEWFFSNKGNNISGYTKAIFSGLTTNTLSRIICEIIENQRSLEGLYHVSSVPIDKYSLLTLLRDAFKLDIRIRPDDSLNVNKSLNCNLFREKTGINIPSWSEMIDELYLDKTPYDMIRRKNVHR
jgi:dTDP-4-dehydrorhamnose reductase